jgi:tetraacyldisaccharide 4'-kinase
MIAPALEVLYGAGVRLRLAAYEAGIARRRRAPCPVISVGNLEVGAMGKTPFTIELANRLIRRGRRVAVLSRGYGRADEEDLAIVSIGEGPRTTAALGGDEPVLVAQRTRAIVVASADRAHAAELVVRDLGADVIVLDDGFQHLQLERDVDLVLLDRAAPFDGDRLLPVGRLREGPEALARADLLVLVGQDAAARDGAPKEVLPPKPIVEVAVEPDAVMHLGRRHAPSSLRGRRVALISGIGRPERFRRMVEGLGAEVVHHVARRDHAVIGDGEIDRFLEAGLGADLLLTTEKDAARMGAARPPSLAVLAMSHRIERGEDHLERAIDRVLR